MQGAPGDSIDPNVPQRPTLHSTFSLPREGHLSPEEHGFTRHFFWLWSDLVIERTEALGASGTPGAQTHRVALTVKSCTVSQHAEEMHCRFVGFLLPSEAGVDSPDTCLGASPFCVPKLPYGWWLTTWARDPFARVHTLT